MQCNYRLSTEIKSFVFLIMSNNPKIESVDSKYLSCSFPCQADGIHTEGPKTIKRRPTVANRTDVVCRYDTRAYSPSKQADCIVKDAIWFTYRWGYMTHTHTLLPGGKARHSKHWYFLALAALAVEANIQIKPLLAVASLCTTGWIHLLCVINMPLSLIRRRAVRKLKLHNQ